MIIDNQKREHWWDAWRKKHAEELLMLFGNGSREIIESWCSLAFTAGWNSASMFGLEEEKGGNDGA